MILWFCKDFDFEKKNDKILLTVDLFITQQHKNVLLFQLIKLMSTMYTDHLKYAELKKIYAHKLPK